MCDFVGLKSHFDSILAFPVRNDPLETKEKKDIRMGKKWN